MSASPTRTAHSAAGQSADRWVALLVGNEMWADGEQQPGAVTRLSASVELGALLVSIGTVWAHRVAVDTRTHSNWVRVAPLIFTAACAVMAIGPIRTALGRHPPGRSFARQLGSRTVLIAVVVATAFATVPGWWALTLWPFGVVLGVDAAITSWAIGWFPTPLRAYTAYLRSPVHLGLLGGLLGAFVFRGWRIGLRSALPIYAAFQIWGLVGTVTVSWLGVQSRRERNQLDKASVDAVNDQHRRAAHWLHDDICAELRLVALQVQRRDADLDDVERMLDNLDHQLRLRQLDELLESGSVRLAEVIQPYLRRAQLHAVIHDVPSFDQASPIVDSETGRLLGRAAAVLTSNALNAGARILGFTIESTSTSVTIAVSDDAGGFPTKELPPGRGLWSLRNDPRIDTLTIDDISDGSRVCITISLPARTVLTSSR